ncbi:L,D-transpeptidase family protein [Novosphingobium panipatense]|uniref:L,D-transpeptidase catalytic domain n=1 Tax=Novosphingobium panipatense TaxID=428991 RepID=A0ABY1QQL7_9SPHN|nr:L,D-transpeptidase family protein [Novosphingobium panipatense]SMP77903.1 L,D-transpeptidase catalytic domain [Novosphingobium panipatense]
MRGLLRFAPLFLALAIGGAATGAQESSALPQIDLIRVRKAARIMELHSGGQVVRVLQDLQFGRVPTGHKRFEGDGRTPEGRYTIDWRNPKSAFHLSLHISYPGEADRSYARARGRSPGGMIMIHGQPNAWPAGRVPGDWTDGCIAITNAEIETLWSLVPDGTPIEIEP